MTERKSDVAAFMGALRGMTDVRNLRAIATAENEFYAKAVQMYGYMALSKAFQSFVVETVELSSQWGGQGLRPSATYGWLLPRLVSGFQTACGAQRQALAGYPIPAFAQLRNVFDSAVVSSAVAQRFASYNEVEGVEDGVPFDPAQSLRGRKKAEFRIFAKMIGAESDLSASTREELGKLNIVFDAETHGQRMSATQAMGWMRGEGPLLFLPSYEVMGYALFLNRYCEVAWMLHRLMPFVRPEGGVIPDQWRDRWNTLDNGFRQTAVSLSAEVGKPIGDAFVEFMDKKFPFEASSALAAAKQIGGALR